MTRKDYKVLATAINATLHSIGGSEVTLIALVKNLVPQLKKDNPRFSEEKFIDCSIVK